MTAKQKRTEAPPEWAAESAVFKALGHPERLRIVALLAAGPRCVCELHRPESNDLSTLSKHLAVLRRAGVVATARRGREIHYTLSLPCAGDFLTCLRGKSGRGVACDCKSGKPGPS